MAISFARSPKYFRYPQISPAQSFRLILEINGNDEYTIIKNFYDGSILIEYAELVRDFIEVKYDNPITWSAKVVLHYSNWEGLNATGTKIDEYSSVPIYFSDGYGYFEKGSNDTISNFVGLMQTNKIIYKYADADVRIPIDRNATDSVIYLFKGEIVSSEQISSSPDYPFQYVGNSSDGFEDRVVSDGGTYENTKCISEFLDEFEISEVDEIRVVPVSENVDLEIVKVKNIEECKFTPAKVSFVNKFGAIQDVWFFKKSIETLNTKRETFNRFAIDAAGGYDTSDHQRKEFNVGATKSIKLNTGYVDESYNSVMQELMQSEYVWMKMDEVVTPMNVKANSLTFKTSVNDKLVDYSLDLEYSFSVINNVR